MRFPTIVFAVCRDFLGRSRRYTDRPDHGHPCPRYLCCRGLCGNLPPVDPTPHVSAVRHNSSQTRPRGGRKCRGGVVKSSPVPWTHKCSKFLTRQWPAQDCAIMRKRRGTIRSPWSSPHGIIRRITQAHMKSHCASLTKTPANCWVSNCWDTGRARSPNGRIFVPWRYIKRWWFRTC